MARIKEKEAENSFVIAQFYGKQKNFKAARIYYKEVVKNYPDTSWSPKAQNILKEIGE
jgi:outer membrane protein assembly factor BamD (BamD/ComL family)